MTLNQIHIIKVHQINNTNYKTKLNKKSKEPLKKNKFNSKFKIQKKSQQVNQKMIINNH